MATSVKSVQISFEMKKMLDIIYTIPDTMFKNLINCLNQAPPATSRSEAERILRGSVPGLEPKYPSIIVDLLIELYLSSGADDIEPSEYIDLLITMAGSTHLNIDECKRRIRDLQLNTTCVSLIAKSIDLWNELPRKLLRSRILSDVRPFFGDDLGRVPANGLVVHTLVLTFEESSTQKEFHVSFDRTKLVELKSTIDRALHKEGTIQNMMREIHVNLIS